jgi:fibronectin-binding autotransporter adhesin
VTVNALGTLQGTGTIFGNVTNGGTVAPGNSIGTLTIAGDYIGAGGVLNAEVVFGDDTSAADLLAVTGNTSGSTDVKVTNVGGPGAQTNEGIKLVDVGGTSAGTFSLLGDYVFEGDQAVVGGAYAYRLYQGSKTDPSDGDWYLRSELIDAGVVTGPLYAPTVPLYEDYAGVLQEFNQLGTLQQRVGSRSWLQGTDGGAPSPIWGRIDAAHANFEPATSTSGASYDATTWRLQAGLDSLLQSSAAGTLVGGVTIQYGTASADVASMYGNGAIDAVALGLGSTLTWYGEDGFYIDGQAQLNLFDTDLTSSTLGTTLADGNQAFGYALSVEAGRKLGLNANWSLTPQAQLGYSSVSFDRITDQYGGTVSLQRGDTLVGRLGLSADYENDWQDANGETSKTHLYGIGNLYYDFLHGSQVDVSGTSFATQNPSLRGGLGLGGSLTWHNDKYTLFGEALVSDSLPALGHNTAVSAQIGLKAKL